MQPRRKRAKYRAIRELPADFRQLRIGVERAQEHPQAAQVIRVAKVLQPSGLDRGPMQLHLEIFEARDAHSQGLTITLHWWVRWRSDSKAVGNAASGTVSVTIARHSTFPLSRTRATCSNSAMLYVIEKRMVSSFQ